MADTTLGLFINQSIALVSQRLSSAEADALCDAAGVPRTYKALARYPIEQLVRFLEAAVARMFPDKAMTEGMQVFGADAFEAFANTSTGKVGLLFIGKDPWKAADRLPTFYSLSVQYGSIHIKRGSGNEFTVLFRGYRTYPEYHLGLLRHGAKRLKLPVNLTLAVHHFERRGPGDVMTDFDITYRW
jgi:uncharacterized protein (TIGR02265 family)